MVLLVAAVAALVWANSPWARVLRRPLAHRVTIERRRPRASTSDLRHWVNDGLMALFFFVVGLEIKRELVVGELRDRARGAAAGVAALGGMVVPGRCIYVALNAGGAGARRAGASRWPPTSPSPLGVLALLGPRVPPPLKVFLLTLAIVDDIGAILVIAVFYTDDLAVGWLAGRGRRSLAVVAAVRRRRRRATRRCTWSSGSSLWLATFESGVHATIAGVVLGLLTPAPPFAARARGRGRRRRARGPPTSSRAEDVRADGSTLIRESVSLAERLERACCTRGPAS